MSEFQALVITISLSSLFVAVIELSKKVNRPIACKQLAVYRSELLQNI
ncbi:hypothetical protein [Cytobacillus praedii]|nr:hypothetical protein [Cytobacillus praedii]